MQRNKYDGFTIIFFFYFYETDLRKRVQEILSRLGLYTEYKRTKTVLKKLIY